MLEMKDICISYRNGGKKFPVIEGLTVEFARGFNVILGPNGAGKTTLMKAVFGILPYSGQILMDGRDIAPLSIEEKTRLISYLPQMDISSSNLTVLEMALLGRVPDLGYRVKDEDLQIVVKVLRDLGLEALAGRPFTQLSGGQQKMVLIAQTLVRSPSLILLDEPTDGLDPNQKFEMRRMIKEMGREKAILISTHLLDEVEDICTRVVIIDKGRLVMDKPIADVKGHLFEIFRKLTAVQA